jgi:CheY-like chemotaxis protein
MARQQFFMLITLDVMLPGIDGFEVLKRVRQISKTQSSCLLPSERLWSGCMVWRVAQTIT